MLAQLDDGVGRVLARLRSEGLEERTLVVFLSDNGGPTRELTSRNGPLRGEKGQLWEGGIRVPCVLAWPCRVAAGRAVDVPVSSLDATHTALELAGANVPEQALDGVSLRPLFVPDGGTLPERDLYWRVGGKQALRRGNWKLVRDGGPWQLYNLADDVGETTDLAAREPQRVRDLEARWQRWNAEQVPPLW
jgi:arylsulfatase B